MQNKNDQKDINRLTTTLSDLKKKKIQTWSVILTTIFFSIPYLAALTIMEFAKSSVSNLTPLNFIYMGVLILVTAIVALLHAKVKAKCHKLVEDYFNKKIKI